MTSVTAMSLFLVLAGLEFRFKAGSLP